MRPLKTVTLERFCSCHFGVFGRMAIGDQILFTCERPWEGNKPMVSCIPNGDYGCSQKWFNRGGYHTFELNVDDRSHILFHKGNTMNDTKGCILMGLNLGMHNGMWAVMNSKEAFEVFWNNLREYDEFYVDITGIYASPPISSD